MFRLLAINNEDISTRSQSQVVSLLKSFDIGIKIKLKVSRWIVQDWFSSIHKSADQRSLLYMINYKLNPYKDIESEYDEIHTVEIKLPKTQSATLGLQLQNPNDDEYSGLFIEKIVHNSTAEKVSMHNLY